MFLTQFFSQHSKFRSNNFFLAHKFKFFLHNFSILSFSLSHLNKFCETIEISIETLLYVKKFSYFGIAK